MNDIQGLSHTKWECKYHGVWIPKCRRKVLYGQLRKNLGEVFHELARQKESKVLEGHLQPDHVHMMLSIPPKYSVGQVVGYMKAKAQSILRGPTSASGRITAGCISGHEGILCQQLAARRKLFGTISKSRRKKIIELNNFRYSKKVE